MLILWAFIINFSSPSVCAISLRTIQSHAICDISFTFLWFRNNKCHIFFSAAYSNLIIFNWTIGKEQEIENRIHAIVDFFRMPLRCWSLIIDKQKIPIQRNAIIVLCFFLSLMLIWHVTQEKVSERARDIFIINLLVKEIEEIIIGDVDEGKQTDAHK